MCQTGPACNVSQNSGKSLTLMSSDQAGAMRSCTMARAPEDLYARADMHALSRRSCANSSCVAQDQHRHPVHVNSASEV